MVVDWARRVFNKHHPSKATVTGTAFRDVLSQFYALCGGDPDQSHERAVSWVFNTLPGIPIPSTPKNS